MAAEVLNTILRDPPLQPAPVHAMIMKMKMQKQIESVLSLRLRKKDLSTSEDLKHQPQVTSLTFILRRTGPSLFHCQHQKRRHGSKPKWSKLIWFLLT